MSIHLLLLLFLIIIIITITMWPSGAPLYCVTAVAGQAWAGLSMGGTGVYQSAGIQRKC